MLAFALLLGGALARSGQATDTARVVTKPGVWWAEMPAAGVVYAFWANMQPHYGAKWGGLWCYGQQYVGPGGNGATCGSSAGRISTWNWWGAAHNYLLLPKGNWLLPPWPGKEQWKGPNYRAICWYY